MCQLSEELHANTFKEWQNQQKDNGRDNMSRYLTGGVQRLNFEIIRVHEWPEERKTLYKEKRQDKIWTRVTLIPASS